MHFIVRHIAAKAAAIVLLLGLSATTYAQEDYNNTILADLDFNVELLSSDLLLADNRATTSSARVSTPNIPDSAFEKPMFTENNLHMYLGLASMAMGIVTAVTVPSGADPDLLNTVHYKAAKASWQLGAAAVGTGLYTHWDDFHLEDGILDRDNLHVLLGLAGTIGYYLAVKGAVNNYNNNAGTVGTEHASKGIFGGVAMITAIALTW